MARRHGIGNYGTLIPDPSYFLLKTKNEENNEDFKNACGFVKKYIADFLQKDNASNTKSFNLRLMAYDNALLCLTKTSITCSGLNKEKDFLCFGIYIQFNLVRETTENTIVSLQKQVSDVCFVEGGETAFKNLTTLQNTPPNLVKQNKLKVKASDIVGQDFKDMYFALYEDCDIANKGVDGYRNLAGINRYLIYENMPIENGYLYESFKKFRDLSFVKSCRYDGTQIQITLQNDKKTYVNIVKGNQFEAYGNIIGDFDTTKQYLEKMYYDVTKLVVENNPLTRYSKSKDIRDLTNPDLKNLNQPINEHLMVDNDTYDKVDY